MTNSATVQAMYDAFGRGDIPFILDQLTDDVSWEDGALDHGVPWLRPGVGKDHVMAFFGVLADFEFRRFEIESVSGAGDIVVGVLQVGALVRSTGRSFESLEVHVWRFDAAGKVRAFNHVLDTVQHVAAAQAA
ncbi:MAG: nuclear transport factor 2 family protein [Acidimicrobiales bacterium]